MSLQVTSVKSISDRLSENYGRSASTIKGAGTEKVALVTTLPSVVKELSGVDARSLTRRSVTKVDMQSYAQDHGISNLNLSLYFVPALTGEWTQFDLGHLSQLRNALRERQSYDRVINICHAVPVYRRSRIDPQEHGVNALIQFANTLTVLTAFSAALQGEMLEPRCLDRASYSFKNYKAGAISISDMEVQSGWLDDGCSDVWAPATGVGLQNLSGLPVPSKSRAGASNHSVLDDWLEELGMEQLLSRFIYSDYKCDFEADVEKLWELNEGQAEEEKVLLDADEVFCNALRKNGLGIDVKNNPLVNSAFGALKESMGGAGRMKMIDISHLLDLNDAGRMKEGSVLSDVGRVILKMFPYSVAFQKMWDRQAKLYDQPALNGRTNAWYISNGLLHAKSTLKTEIPLFNVWAVPVVPTNSVRFVLRPDLQEKYTCKAVRNALTRLNAVHEIA